MKVRAKCKDGKGRRIRSGKLRISEFENLKRERDGHEDAWKEKGEYVRALVKVKKEGRRQLRKR